MVPGVDLPTTDVSDRSAVEIYVCGYSRGID